MALTPNELFGELGIQELRERFPQIARLGDVFQPQAIPHVATRTDADESGAACLAMVLGFLGREVCLEDVVAAMASQAGGITVSSILAAASLYELQGRRIKIPLRDLPRLPAGAIVQLRSGSFVVLESATRDALVVIDPVVGRRTLSATDAGDDGFTGVALLFERGDGFDSSFRGKSVLRRHLFRAFRSSRNWLRIAIASLALQLFASALPFVNGQLVDRVVPRADYELLFVLLGGFSFVVVFQFVVMMVRSHLLVDLQTRIDASMTMGFLDHMLRLPYAFFQGQKPADLLIRVNSMSAIRATLSASVVSAMLDGSLVLGYLVMLVLLSPRIAGFSFLVVVTVGSAYLVTRRRLRELTAAGVVKQAEAASYLTEALGGIESLKALGCEHRASQKWAGQYVDLLNNNLERVSIGTWSDSLITTMRTVSPVMMMLVSVTEVMNGHLTLGTMLTANYFACAFIVPVVNLVGNFTQLQLVSIQLSRVEDVLTTPSEQFSEVPRQLQAMGRISGAIELRNVSFRYAPDLPEVVKDISLRIEPGQMIALVGPTASGKSTLASLLLGLYAPTEGQVLYDGVDLQNLDIRTVRRQLGVVVQKSHIFGTSIRANIALADPDAPLETIKAAARLANIAEEIESMPMRYDTPVVGGGGTLSGGQRQRLALARALVTDPKVLLLDEATSALDAQTEERVHENIDRLGCTRVLVAHRLSTVVNADRIVVIKDGRIVEQGTHDELLATGQVYCDLVHADDKVRLGGQAGVSRPS